MKVTALRGRLAVGLLLVLLPSVRPALAGGYAATYSLGAGTVDVTNSTACVRLNVAAA